MDHRERHRQVMFRLFVNAVVSRTLAVAPATGDLIFVLNGMVGPDCIIQASSNLLNWQPILVTNPMALPATYVETNMAAFPAQFYRVVIGP